MSMDVEAVQLEVGFGPYQIRSLALILLSTMIAGAYNVNYVFAAGDVKYRCAVPECESNPPQFIPGKWGEWALPKDEAARCYSYKKADSNNACIPVHFTNVTEPCNSWVYESNETIVAEFNLACADWKRALVGTVHSIGNFVALSYVGLLSDRFGRLPVFVAMSSIPSVIGMARGLCNSYILYVVLEFADPALGIGSYTAGFVLVTEMISSDLRVLTSTLLPISFSLGQVVLAGAAWTLPGWRTLTLVLYLPSALFLAFYILLDESPRWLAARGRTQDAAVILLSASKINGVTFSPELVQKLTEDSPQNKGVPPPDTKTSLASQVIHSKLLMGRLAMCGFWWITCSFVFYGLSINSVSLAGNKYLNFMLTSFADIPGYMLTIYALKHFGRRASLRTAFLLCGVALISLPLIPKGSSSVLLALTLIGKVWISMAFGSLYIFTAELFPTQARNTMVATSSMIGRIGLILAPLTPLLAAIWRPLPYATFGGVAVAASMLTLLAPETRHTLLPDTVAQAEQAHKDRAKRKR